MTEKNFASQVFGESANQDTITSKPKLHTKDDLSQDMIDNWESEMDGQHGVAVVQPSSEFGISPKHFIYIVKNYMYDNHFDPALIKEFPQRSGIVVFRFVPISIPEPLATILKGSLAIEPNGVSS